MSEKKIPVRMSQLWIREMISMMEACYDLEWEGNQDAVVMLKYLKKRLEAF